MRFEVWMIQLNPTIGAEVQKKRPCLVVSPDIANKYLQTVTILPLTSTLKTYPTRINCEFEGRKGQLMIDQIRSVDKTRLIEKRGTLNIHTCRLVCEALVENFRF